LTAYTVRDEHSADATTAQSSAVSPVAGSSTTGEQPDESGAAHDRTARLTAPTSMDRSAGIPSGSPLQVPNRNVLRSEAGDPGWELREAEPVVVEWFRLLDSGGAPTSRG